MVSNLLRVLLLEDNVNDAELVVAQLNASGLNVQWERVETEADYLAHLTPELDLILADYNLPQFDGLSALRFLQERGLDIPFILVSGSIGEERAVAAMQAGAADYLLKDRLARLGPAVVRALDQKQLRLEKHSADRMVIQSERHFRSLIEHAPDGIALLGMDGRLKYVSPSTHTLLGYLPEEVIGLDPAGLTHPDDLPGFLMELSGLVQKPGASIKLEYRFLHHDGSWRWLESTITNIIAEPGVGAVVFNYRDVTERKLAEESLRSSEALTSSVLAAINMHLAVLGADGTILQVNPAWERFAVENGDLTLSQTGVGTNYFEICRRAALANAPGAQEALDGIRAVMKGELPTFSLEYACDSPEEKRWFVMYVVPLAFTNGAVVTHVDISARKAAELAEREQRTFAEALSDTAEALNSTLDFDTVLERILENAGRVVPHDASTIMLLEGRIARVVGSRGYSKAGSETIMSLHLDVEDTPNLNEILRTGRPELIHDTRTYAGWRTTAVTAEQRSAIVVPIRHRYVTIGFISLDGYQPNAFSEADGDRLLAFADQAAIALENARLFRETGARLADLEAINKVSTALRQVQRLEEMVPLFLRQSLALCKIKVGSIWLLDETTGQMRRMANEGLGWEVPALYAPDDGILGAVMRSGVPYVSREFKSDPRTDPGTRESIPRGQGGVCLPLRTADKVVGVLFGVVELPRELTPAEVDLLTTLSEIAGNTIHRMQLDRETDRQLERLGSLRVIDQAINSSLDLNLVLHILLDQVVSRLGIDAAAILLLNPDTNRLELGSARGFRSRTAHSSAVNLGEDLAGQAALDRRIINIHNLEREHLSVVNRHLFQEEGFVAYYAVPLITKGMVTGVLELFERTPRSPRPEWVDFVQALAGQAGIAIDNATLFKSLQESNSQLVVAYDETIEGWSRALDLRDKETEGHTRRVTEMTMRLARLAGVPENAMVHVRRGALLHDIGKMGVPDNILLKPGPLTEQEWTIMRMHPTFAYEMLYPIIYLRPALEIPYCHHEKIDGTGYPRGLKEQEIPLAARVFSIVDVWDALRSDRPYRKAWSEDKTRAHLQALAGTQFDARILNLFLNMSQ